MGTVRVAPINGINRIQLTTGGSISGAYIGTSSRIDEFWTDPQERFALILACREK